MLSRVMLLSVLGAVFLVAGCVPYQTYKGTKDELERAKSLNADLVRKYNDAMLRLRNAGGEGTDPGLLAELAALRRENEELKQGKEFTPAEVASIPGSENEGGGLRLGEALLFAEGRADFRPGAQTVLDGVVSLLMQPKYRDNMVIIEGHTDNQPLKQTKKLWQHNMRLGYERAQKVFEYFITQGIPESRMVVRAYSFNKPTDPATVDSPAGRAKNRRVVVRLGSETQI